MAPVPRILRVSRVVQALCRSLSRTIVSFLRSTSLMGPRTAPYDTQPVSSRAIDCIVNAEGPVFLSEEAH